MKVKFVLTFLVLLMIVNPSYGGPKDDILDVEGKAVVFFEPTEKEYNSLSENEKNEWNEVLSDFYHYRDSIIPDLESNNIKPVITSAMKITIHFAGDKSRTYIRKKFKQNVGYLLTDGNKEPKVILGVRTDVDLMIYFKQYFKIK